MLQQSQDNTPNILSVGLIGHRNILTSETFARIKVEARQHFNRWHSNYEHIEVISPLAVGGDMLLAEVALEFGATLVAVVPFTGYEYDFESDDLNHYRLLRDQASDVITLPFSQRSREAFFEAGKWVVDHSQLILAAWDGKPARDLGGTGDVVAYAHTQNKTVHIIYTTTGG